MDAKDILMSAFDEAGLFAPAKDDAKTILMQAFDEAGLFAQDEWTEKDEAKLSDSERANLAKHDKARHGGYFDPETMTCKFREKLKEGVKIAELKDEVDDEKDNIEDDPDVVGFNQEMAERKKEDRKDSERDDIEVDYVEGNQEQFQKQQPKIEGLSNKAEKKFREMLMKKHPEFDIDLVLTEIGKIKDKQLQKDAFAWVMKGAIRLPEDMYKVEQARQLATKAKKDPLSYDTPQACINELLGEGHKITEKPITVEELKHNPLMSDYRDEGYGVETFQVDDSREGQKLMRKVIDTHWGKDANPWCLLARGDSREDEEFENWWDSLSWGERNKYGATDYFTEENDIEDGSDESVKALQRARQYFDENFRKPDYEKSLDYAWHYWKNYDALPKRVAFKDGKLLAFMGTSGEEEQWWDRNDKPHAGIPIGKMPVPNDKMQRIGTAEINNGNLSFVKKEKAFEDGRIFTWHDNDNIYEYIFPDGTKVSHGRVSGKVIGLKLPYGNGSYRHFGENDISEMTTKITPEGEIYIEDGNIPYYERDKNGNITIWHSGITKKILSDGTILKEKNNIK